MATKKLKNRPRMLTLGDIMTTYSNAYELKEHHSPVLDHIHPNRIFSTLLGGNRWSSISWEENHEEYKRWYFKTYTKLGRALE
jgi:hypothetical protein